VQRIASYPKITVTEGGRGVCAATFKHGFGYHPLLAWLDNTREALAGDAAARNANANTAADHITATDEALAQIPDEHTDPDLRRRRRRHQGMAGAPPVAAGAARPAT